MYIGQHDHVMETILELSKPPYKNKNKNSSPLNHKQLTYRLIGTIAHTKQLYYTVDKTTSLLESKTPNHV